MATAPRGLADLAAREIRDCEVADISERNAGVRFSGTLRSGYLACLWSRVASRVLLEILDFEAPDTEGFYRGACQLDWRAHLGPGATLACEFTGAHPTITHSQFGALKLKDAICDQLRAATGQRPNIDLRRPAVRVVAHAAGTRVLLYIDLAGEGLHRRGYRVNSGEAPLRENLAAGVLLRAGWPDMAAAGAAFLDPMCGSGTLPIEAALIAAGAFWLASSAHAQSYPTRPVRIVTPTSPGSTPSRSASSASRRTSPSSISTAARCASATNPPSSSRPRASSPASSSANSTPASPTWPSTRSSPNSRVPRFQCAAATDGQARKPEVRNPKPDPPSRERRSRFGGGA